MSRHVSDRELMLSLDGELPSRRQALLTQHVEACRVCRDKSDHFRATMAAIERLYRGEYGVSTRSPDYGRVRLAATLREAASSEPTWLHGTTQFLTGPLLNGLSLSHAIGTGLVMIAVCAAAVFAVRMSTAPAAHVPSDVLPQSSLTPGAVSALTTAELCNGVRPSRLVTDSVRRQVLHAYQMEEVPAATYELDALITPELGGSTDPANLWPQRYRSPVWNARVKDALERALPEMVCRQQITLAQAQQEIASDWIAAYKHHFHTEMPLRAHLGPSDDEDAELVLVRGEAAVTQVATVRIVSR
jgi:hypothetical protein